MRASFPAWGRAALGALLLASGTLSAQSNSSCVTTGSGAAAGDAARWTSPLDRPISFRSRDISLRDALDRVAALADLRLSYVSEFLPLDKSVCATFENATAGSALAALLSGTGVEPVKIAGNLIVLVPSDRLPRASRTSALAVRPPAILDRVVVTGSATGASIRGLPVSLDALRTGQLGEHSSTTLSESMNGAVPGLWVWEQSPTALLTRYGSIRGASSFGLSYPKIYVDGIEVANPLLVTDLSPETIERVEVIRGPQGAALYGANAISGVINIITRHDGTDGGGTEVKVRSGLGVAGSSFVPRPALAQDYALTARTGTDLRSGDIALTVRTLGSVTPTGFSRQIATSGGVRFVGAQSNFNGTARVSYHTANDGISPLLLASVPSRSDSLPRGLSQSVPASQSVWQYTVGGKATFTPDGQWTHSVIAGIDGYRLSNVALDATPIPSALDSALRAAGGGADRLSIRASSAVQLGADQLPTTLTLAAEHSELRDQSSVESPQGAGGEHYDGGPAFGTSKVAWLRNTGVVVQINSSVADQFFITAGLRVERNDGFTSSDRIATLPMVGAAFVRGYGDVTMKLRAAYGRGIRPARTPTRNLAWLGVGHSMVSPSLAPEEQSGVEGGVDLFFGRSLAFHLTRFDQLASGLIQQVPKAADAPSGGGGGGPMHRLYYVLQNVGEIANRGWEAEGSVSHGMFSVSGTFSLVDSRVRRLAPGYTGDLFPGARVLDVPATTLGVNASWSNAPWTAALSVSRAMDWIGYDRLALASMFAGASGSYQGMVGPPLRSYWRAYDGATRLRASGSRELRAGFAILITGDNLLNAQLGEPDNVTIVPGRSVTAGVRVKF